jgi:hypothetical protein
MLISFRASTTPPRWPSARNPKDCVHWASGDMRIGKQLLDAAADDARISVAFLSLSGAASAGLIGRPLEALRGHLAA